MWKFTVSFEEAICYIIAFVFVSLFNQGCVALLSVTWTLCLTVFGFLVLPKGRKFVTNGIKSKLSASRFRLLFQRNWPFDMRTVLQQTVLSNIGHLLIVLSNDHDSDVLLRIELPRQPPTFGGRHTIGYDATNTVDCSLANGDGYPTHCCGWHHHSAIATWKGKSKPNKHHFQASINITHFRCIKSNERPY